MAEIHIIAPFIDANGGDWRAVDLYCHLRTAHHVSLWSPGEPIASMAHQYPIRRIKPYGGQVPASGILIVWGAHTEIGHWYEQVAFQKVILVHNLFAPDVLYRGLHRLTLNGTRPVEIKYVSKMLKDTIGLDGDVIYLAPHQDRFKPRKRTGSGNFVVGRASRDVLGKHHYSDVNLYRKLADKHIHVKVVGGSCLKPWLDESKYLELLPAVSQDLMAETLSGFDCFFYRTSLLIKEAFGLVVAEAMLCGLPVVCHSQGGYSEIIRHGENGFLFDTDAEAIEIIELLKHDKALRNNISECASSTIMELNQVPPLALGEH